MKDWCEVHFAYSLMVIVCVMNALKCLGLLYVILWTRKQSVHCVTQGDAMASFLESDDSVDSDGRGFKMADIESLGERRLWTLISQAAWWTTVAV